jgi:hypothetical protein
MGLMSASRFTESHGFDGATAAMLCVEYRTVDQW